MEVNNKQMSLEYLISLLGDDPDMVEAAMSIHHIQSHEPPADIEALPAYLNMSKRFEVGMEVINYDKNTGLINAEQATEREAYLYSEIYGKEK